MNETWTTLQGWVGTEVTSRETGYGTVATFRIGCTPRFRREGQWTDGQTSWFTVNAWRALGENVASSVNKGDAVVVHGRLRMDVWERGEKLPEGLTPVVEASFVAHDLNRGTSRFEKVTRPERQDPRSDPELREQTHGSGPGGTQQADHNGEGQSAA